MPSPDIRNALISVSDKQALLPLARVLAAAGVEIYSTGGTRRHLEASGLAVRDVSEYTGFPEMMGGRLKTLHPKVFGGVLCRRDRDDDMAALAEQGIVSFELVVVNLYPFEATIAREGVTPAEAIEQIDIGGPSLVRAAAKNHRFTTVVTDSSQYNAVAEQFQTTGRTTAEFRFELAAAAFSRTADYDTAIANYFARDSSDSVLAPQLTLRLSRRQSLRYGENPHQQAALYAIGEPAAPGLLTGEQLHGKELSYNNLLDLDAALAIARSLPAAAAVVIKHNNPCGAASADSLAEAMRAALAGDPISAFGSVLGVNRPLDAETARVLAEPGLFVEAIVAPAFEPAAVDILTSEPKWKANVRLVVVGELTDTGASVEYRHIRGGMLVEQADTADDPRDQWKIVTATQPTDAQMADLQFAWAVVRHVKSNAIVLARDRAVCGVGAGQMSRVDSVEIAIRKAGDRSGRSALASDAFFPFADSIHQAAAAGVSAIIQPGGSRRDDEVIAACDEHELPMIFTGRRHFKH